jgi:hypothetical protein
MAPRAAAQPRHAGRRCGWPGSSRQLRRPQPRSAPGVRAAAAPGAARSLSQQLRARARRRAAPQAARRAGTGRAALGRCTALEGVQQVQGCMACNRLPRPPRLAARGGSEAARCTLPEMAAERPCPPALLAAAAAGWGRGWRERAPGGPRGAPAAARAAAPRRLLQSLRGAAPAGPRARLRGCRGPPAPLPAACCPCGAAPAVRPAGGRALLALRRWRHRWRGCGGVSGVAWQRRGAPRAAAADGGVGDLCYTPRVAAPWLAKLLAPGGTAIYSALVARPFSDT